MTSNINVRTIDTFDGGVHGLYPCRIELRRVHSTHNTIMVLFASESGVIDFDALRSFESGMVKPLSPAECDDLANLWSAEFNAAWDTLEKSAAEWGDYLNDLEEQAAEWEAAREARYGLPWSPDRF